jgi:hypothetical protein
MRPQVSLADLLTAIHALRPADGEASEALRVSFDLGGLERRAAELPRSLSSRRPVLPVVKIAVSEQAPQPRLADGPPIPASLRQLEQPDSPPEGDPSWSAASALGDRAALRGAQAPMEPLFLPQWMRGITTAALATSAEDGRPDVERLVEAIARGQSVQRVPRESIATLRRGAEVLCDVSEGMLPFARDQDEMVQHLRSTVGRHRLRVTSFDGPPLIDSTEGEPSWTPARGTPVLILSDLGIAAPLLVADRSTPARWLVLARALRRAGCPVVALVPYPPDRWPLTLSRAISIIEWNRRATAAMAQRAVRLAERTARG